MREQGPLIWLPTLEGTASQLPLDWPRYFYGAVGFAVLLDEAFHDIVHGFQQLGLRMRPPGLHGDNVVTGFRLRFGCDGQDESLLPWLGM